MFCRRGERRKGENKRRREREKERKREKVAPFAQFQKKRNEMAVDGHFKEKPSLEHQP